MLPSRRALSACKPGSHLTVSSSTPSVVSSNSKSSSTEKSHGTSFASTVVNPSTCWNFPPTSSSSESAAARASRLTPDLILLVGCSGGSAGRMPRLPSGRVWAIGLLEVRADDGSCGCSSLSVPPTRSRGPYPWALILWEVRSPVCEEREGPLEVPDLAPMRCGARWLHHSVTRLLRLREVSRQAGLGEVPSGIVPMSLSQGVHQSPRSCRAISRGQILRQLDPAGLCFVPSRWETRPNGKELPPRTS